MKHRTPPVVVQLQPQPAVQAVVAALMSIAVAGIAAWACSRVPDAWPAWFLVPVTAALAWRAAAVTPRRLRWDGEAWWLTAPGPVNEVPVSLDVLIDLDTWLLLRAGSCWLPLSRHQQAAHWGALRATLYAAPGGALQR